MSAISTISELFTLSDSQYRIYDVGRKIDKISKEQFKKIELNQQPYPFPSQGHAFIAAAFWQKGSTAPYLWFVKIPLDERGLLNQGARNHFIAIIIEALGSDLSADPTEQQETLLKNNPYHFTPAQYKLAALNSIISRELKQTASSYYRDCFSYLSGENGWDQWHKLGVQGISDFAARIDDKTHQQILIRALPELPPQVLAPLCSALENKKYPVEVIRSLLGRLKDAIDSGESELEQALLRALASNCEHVDVTAFADDYVLNPDISSEQLITLSGRCWSLLRTPERLSHYLELLIAKEDNELFTAIFKDLVAIPLIRPILFQCMRAPDRSPALAKAIGQLFH
ncbi:DUF3549 family protein [Thalassomonas viridans]|uniref:DUF3549 family protein n=1 Tax=Thalassomonas viridans TaxID=137584 RepID=A0AAE9Z8A1_9GAMM|nr:DUF3549 family protein [Thalassomonas viridans]WDE06917.1 DUF3549 family protein [Thalassomonas viridans]